jgi:hypothetical protein
MQKYGDPRTGVPFSNRRQKRRTVIDLDPIERLAADRPEDAPEITPAPPAGNADDRQAAFPGHLGVPRTFSAVYFHPVRCRHTLGDFRDAMLDRSAYSRRNRYFAWRDYRYVHDFTPFP